MTPHEEYLELCAAATAGELNLGEQAKLDAHLTECAECRKAMREYEIASQHGVQYWLRNEHTRRRKPIARGLLKGPRKLSLSG
jgi:Putative zinc-finger